MSLHGRFCWMELYARDREAAAAFYCAVVGYVPRSWAGHDYTLLAAGEHTVGGVVSLDEEALAAGAPPQWLPYVGVDDVDAFVPRALGLGARAVVPPFDAGDVGRVAVLQDPALAAFAVLARRDGAGMNIADAGPGHVAWRELATDGVEAAWAFYADLFAWTHPTPDLDRGPIGPCRRIRPPGADADVGGMHTRPAEQGRAAWLHFLSVHDLDAALARVVDGGGQVVSGPMVVPTGDRVARCVDPEGARFGLSQPPG
jgi:predicted enzyme related to lactoylglutathione lyase